jgi:hypothetical protein
MTIATGAQLRKVLDYLRQHPEEAAAAFGFCDVYKET